MAELSARRVALLGMTLVFVGALGFYHIPGMIDESAGGSKVVNSLYCSVITLSTIGFGDVCPDKKKLTHVGRTFLVVFTFVGVGMFCGPVMNVASNWKNRVPGGLTSLVSLTLAIGVIIFTRLEEMSQLEAVYAVFMAGTTIGYGDATPSTDAGKVLVTLYSILAINVVAAMLEPAKIILETFCRAPLAPGKKQSEKQATE